MIWILIWTLSITSSQGVGVTSGSHEFNGEEACMIARKHFIDSNSGSIFRTATAVCVKHRS